MEHPYKRAWPKAKNRNYTPTYNSLRPIGPSGFIGKEGGRRQGDLRLSSVILCAFYGPLNRDNVTTYYYYSRLPVRDCQKRCMAETLVKLSETSLQKSNAKSKEAPCQLNQPEPPR